MKFRMASRNVLPAWGRYWVSRSDCLLFMLVAPFFALRWTELLPPVGLDEIREPSPSRSSPRSVPGIPAGCSAHTMPGIDAPAQRKSASEKQSHLPYAHRMYEPPPGRR